MLKANVIDFDGICSVGSKLYIEHIAICFYATVALFQWAD